jgi:hypothetical protein
MEGESTVTIVPNRRTWALIVVTGSLSDAEKVQISGDTADTSIFVGQVAG